VLQLLVEVRQPRLAFVLYFLHGLHLAQLGLCRRDRVLKGIHGVVRESHTFVLATRPMRLPTATRLMTPLIIKQTRLCRWLADGLFACCRSRLSLIRHDLLFGADEVRGLFLFVPAILLLVVVLSILDLFEKAIHKGAR